MACLGASYLNLCGSVVRASRRWSEGFGFGPRLGLTYVYRSSRLSLNSHIYNIYRCNANLALAHLFKRPQNIRVLLKEVPVVDFEKIQKFYLLMDE